MKKIIKENLEFKIQYQPKERAMVILDKRDRDKSMYVFTNLTDDVVEELIMLDSNAISLWVDKWIVW